MGQNDFGIPATAAVATCMEEQWDGRSRLSALRARYGLLPALAWVDQHARIEQCVRVERALGGLERLRE